MEASRDTRKQAMVALCLTAIVFSFGLKLAGLHSRELWLDETYSAFVAQRPFFTMLRNTLGDLHPPLFHVLLWVWVRFVGESEPHLRLFSVLLNLGAMAAMFLTGRRVLGSVWGAYAATLFALLPMLFVYSLEVRSYMLFMLVLAVLLNFYWRTVMEEQTSGRLFWIYAIVAACLFAVHYLAAFVLAALFLHGLWQGRIRRSRVVRLGALTALLCLPGLSFMAVQKYHSIKATREQAQAMQNPEALSHDAKEAHPKNKLVSLATGEAAALGVFPARQKAVLALAAIPLLAVLLMTTLLAVRGDAICSLAALATLLVVAGMLALRLAETRYLLVLAPVFTLALARGVERWLQSPAWRHAGAAVGVLLLAVYAAGLVRQARVVHGRPWGDVVHVLQDRIGPGDRIVFNAAYAQVPFDYAASQAGFHATKAGFPVTIYCWWDSQRDVKGWGGPIITRDDVDQFVKQLERGGRQAWIVEYENHYHDPNSELLAKLRRAGNVREIALPANPDVRADADNEPLQLFQFRPGNVTEH